ncbi:MAG: hypothetical protein RQ966_08635 [Acetobacteraceae bacterium]|nr:hypothetical protein [Acetobacteraceae bacterium]
MMRIAAFVVLLAAPLPSVAATYVCTGQQSQVCSLVDGQCRVANAPGTAIEVDSSARRMRYTQTGREWDLVHVEAGRGAELFALTAQGNIFVIGPAAGGASAGAGYAGTFSSVTFPNASIGLITCTKK